MDCQLDLKDFWESVSNEFKEGHKHVDKLETLASIQDYNEEQDITDMALGSVLVGLKFRVLAVADALHLDRFAEEFRSGWKFAHPTELEMLPWVGVLSCPALHYLERAVDALEVVLPRPKNVASPSEDPATMLARILRATPHIVRERSLDPKNEADVRNAVYSILVHVFPDTVREIPIAHVAKTYKPDIGVRRFKTAIEYKFVDSEDELKVAIGGIYEDIHGYAGSEDWKTYCAVIYMTDAFMTEAQVQAEFDMSDTPQNWQIILVTGRGGRVKRAPPARPAKAKASAPKRQGSVKPRKTSPARTPSVKPSSRAKVVR